MLDIRIICSHNFPYGQYIFCSFNLFFCFKMLSSIIIIKVYDAMDFSLLHFLFHATVYNCTGVFSYFDNSNRYARVFVGDAPTYQSDYCLFVC
jgi:hypothetical protein